MSDVKQKIIKILESAAIDAADKNRVSQEMSYLEDNFLLDDMYSLYRKVQEKFHKGNLNSLNSAVAYYLGITSAKHDPSKPFAVEVRRTYGRSGFPDIDMDFDYERREEIVSYLIEKYGRENVGNIGTKQVLQTKNAIRRVIKILDPENSVVFDKSGNIIKDNRSENIRLENEIANTLPKIMRRADGTFIESVDEAYKEFSEFRRFMDQYPEVKRVASKLEGGISAWSSHAAGIVLSPMPLKYICPLHVTKGEEGDDSGNSKVLATQFTMSDVESLGLIKFDVLGLSTKTAIVHAVNLIKERFGVDIDLENLPLDDKQTLTLLSSGKTAGCFQLEHYGMQQTLQQIGIDSFEDLIVCIAMYRPGPKDYIPELVRRKRGLSKVQYAHPLMEKITKRTYGIVVYQEMCMQVFMSLADLPATDGYKFLKGCAKKKPEIIQQYKDIFITNSMRHSNLSKEVSQKIFADLERFGGYAFNRSHACSYAYESWKTSYLKAHYPTEFFAARLSVELRRRKFDEVEKYEQDAAHNFGIKIHNPDLNKSKTSYKILGDKELLRPILSRGIGLKAADEIVLHQPYAGPDKFYSFALKVGAAVNTKAVEAMCESGLWGSVKKSKILKDFEQIRKDKKTSKGKPIGDIFG